MKKKLFMSMLTASLVCSCAGFAFTAQAETIASTGAAASAAAASDSSDVIMPRADIIKYIYKDVDGKTYRRLFNFSKGVWIGDWELVP